jgi:GntR family transcriptional regulator, transcriptional repressor for pyruvate dehydrogenase complex
MRGEEMSIDPPPKDSLFKPLATKRAFVEISDQIRHLIFSKVLKPGDKLPSERELAAQFGSGRISVREALRMLEQSGLIYVKQGSDGGAFVRDADVSVATESLYDVMRRANVTVNDVAEARRDFERLVLEHAMARFDEEDLATLKQSLDEGGAILAEGSGESHAAFCNRLGETYINFHRAMAKATKNPVFDIIVECLMMVTHTVFDNEIMPSEGFKNHLKYHRALYEALKDRDITRARQILDDHGERIKAHFTHLFPTA